MKCPVCIDYAKFFIRDYGSCYHVYHKNHCCTCEHLHDDRKEYCEGGKECGCKLFQAQDGSSTIEKPKPSRFKNFRNGADLICEHQCGSLTYGSIVVMFDEETIICGGCGWAQTRKYEDYLDSDQYKLDLKEYTKDYDYVIHSYLQ